MPKYLDQWVIKLFVGEREFYYTAERGTKSRFPRSDRLHFARVYPSAAVAQSALTHLRKHWDFLPEWKIHVARVYVVSDKPRILAAQNETQ